MTADALQALKNETMEYKEAMVNLTRINLTLSQSLNQAQETILVPSKQLKSLKANINAKKTATEIPATDKKTRGKNSKGYYWTHGRTHSLDQTSATCR